MIERSILRRVVIGALGLALSQAWGQAYFPTPYVRVFFNGPAAGSPIDWTNSCLVVAKRSAGPLKINMSPSGAGDAEIRCSVRSSSVKRMPAEVSVIVGLNNPPGERPTAPIQPERRQRIESAFPAAQDYLVLVTKPQKVQWSEFTGPVVPRLILPIDGSFRLTNGSGKVALMSSMFDALRTGFPEFNPTIVGWLRDEWRCEEKGLLTKIAPTVPSDRRLSAISNDSEAVEIGEAAIKEASRAASTARTYLTLLAGMWGCQERFRPFFEACASPITAADPGLLESMVDDPKFGELTVDEAIKLAKIAKPEMSGVVFAFVATEGKMTKAQRLDIFYQCLKTPRSQDRYQMYVLMLTDMPQGMSEEYPAGLCPPYRMDGSIPAEGAYRDKWASFLGISTTIKP